MSTQNAVLVGSAHRLSMQSMQIWIKSSRKFFGGEIFMLCYDLKKDVIAGLQSEGISVIVPKEMEVNQVVVGRFRDLATFAREVSPEKWVISTDVTDLSFQNDPMGFLDKITDKSIVAASEGVLFRDNTWTNQNLRNSFEQDYHLMKDEFFVNAGSFAAKAPVMAELAEKVYSMCTPANNRKNHDQAALNIILKKEYAEQLHVEPPDGKWCYCAASSMFAPEEDKKGYEFAYPRIERGVAKFGGHVPVMFHHFTRDEKTHREVARIWANTQMNRAMLRSSI